MKICVGRYPSVLPMWGLLIDCPSIATCSLTLLSTTAVQMQACGTPPDEIVQELSPGLQFDAEGMPKLPEGGPPGCSIQ